MREVWFWQSVVSPHVAGLADALAGQGLRVVYVAPRVMTAERARQGWVGPPLGKCELIIAANKSAMRDAALSAPAHAIHICQGLRGNGLVRSALRELELNSATCWIMMETVDPRGWRGVLRALMYKFLFALHQQHIDGVLAIGAETSRWLVKIGVPESKIFPFAYFLPDPEEKSRVMKPKNGPFAFVFVGQIITRKRLDLLLRALTYLPSDAHFTLWVVGSGPEEHQLRQLADELFPGCVKWRGNLPMHEVSSFLAKADCLVLPSDHDGWGAVVSEALMVGTPVICSDACGSSIVAQSSGHGAIFNAGDMQGLGKLLLAALEGGSISELERKRLASWAHSLGAEAGARYLLDVIKYVQGGATTPSPPWLCRGV